MGESVHVQAIHALGDLERELGHFAELASRACETTRWEMQGIQRRREERLRRLQREVERDRQAAQGGSAAVDAKARLGASEAELARVRHRLSNLESVASTYRQYARRLERVVSEEIPRARALLREKITDLERYLAVRPVAREDLAIPGSGPPASVSPPGKHQADGRH